MGSLLSCDITKLRFFVSSLSLNFQWTLSQSDKRPSVLIGRFSCVLNSLPALAELLAGEAEATKYDTQPPKVSAPSLPAFHQFDHHLV